MRGPPTEGERLRAVDAKVIDVVREERQGEA